MFIFGFEEVVCCVNRKVMVLVLFVLGNELFFFV